MLNEPILEDDFPVHPGYFYVVDDRVICSDISGNVHRLKIDVQSYYGLSAETVKRCDINGRMIANKFEVYRKQDVPIEGCRKQMEGRIERPEEQKRRTCWMLTLDFNLTDESNPRCEVHADSHKKAVKLFTDSVEDIRQGRQPKLDNDCVRTAARTANWKIVKARSV